MKRIVLILIGLYACIYTQAQNNTGFVNINVNVSDMGTAQANMPIECLTGRNGMKPQIAVVYNHQGGNSILGQNMGITGKSAISRGGSNYHLDNKVQEGIKHDNTKDKFYLDGNKLILINGTYGAHGSVYRTEVDLFARITFYNNTTSGYKFVVEQKDGGLLVYASLYYLSANINDLSTTPLAYLLSKQYDKYGNYMEYTYMSKSMELDEIKYNGFDCTLGGTKTCNIPTAPIAPNYSLKFTYNANPTYNNTYETRLFTDQYYSVNKLRLDYITAYFVNGTVTTAVESYMFTYEFKELTYFLTKISQTTNGVSRPDVIFNWSTYEEDTRVKGQVISKNTDFKTTGDFDGDGKTDLLLINGTLDATSGDLLQSFNTFGIWSTGNNKKFNSTPMVSGNLPHANISNISVIDIDADGDDDLVLQTIDARSLSIGSIMTITFSYHLLRTQLKTNSNGQIVFDRFQLTNNFIASTTQQVVGADYRVSLKIPYFFDLEGDGLPDLMERILNVFNNTNDVAYALSTENHATRRQFVNTSVNNAIDVLAAFVPFDFNGDGRKDLFTYDGDFTRVFTFNTQTKLLEYVSSPLGTTSIEIFEVTTGDFNGDGNSDIFYFEKTQAGGGSTYIGEGKIAYSKGKSNFSISPFTNVGMIKSMWCFPMDIEVEVADVNGDGKDDIIERHDHPSHALIDPGIGAANEYRIYYSKGTKEFGVRDDFYNDVVAVNRNTSENPLEFSNHLIGDFDGDGKKDVLMLEGITTRGLNNYVIEYHRRLLRTLNAIQLPKVKYEFIFKPLTQFPGYKKTLNPGISNCISMTLPISVVSQLNIVYPQLTTERIYYNYKDLMHNLHGRGIMGFTQVTKMSYVNEQYNNTQVNTYKQDPFYAYKLNLASTENYNHGLFAPGGIITPSDKVSDMLYEHKTITTSATQKTTFTYAAFTTETNYLTKNVRKICYTYNEDGNLTYKGAIYYPLSTFDVEYSDASDYTYGQFDTWLPASMLTDKNYKTRQGQTTQVTPVTYIYLPGTSILKEKRTFDDTNPMQVAEGYEFDAYGNIIKKGYNHKQNTNTNSVRNSYTVLDANKQFIDFTTNDAGYKTTYEFTPNTQLPKKVTAPNGFISNYTFDAFMRATDNAEHNGNTNSTTYYWDLSQSNSLFTVTQTNNYGEKSVKYYNEKMQLVKEEKTPKYDANNPQKMATKLYTYNGYGLLTSETNWFDPAITATKRSTNFTYDIYKRIRFVSQVQLANNLEEYSYVDNSITHKVGVQTAKTTVFDAVGKYTSVTQGSSTITYTYNSLNLPISITANGSTTTYEYNESGKLTKECNPNGGCTVNEYNPLNELVKTTNAKNNQYILEYDELGRLKNKKGNDNTEYIYDYYTTALQANLNLPKTLTYKKAGVVKNKLEYEYNAFAELKETKELAANGITYTTTNTYIDHRLDEIQYPNITIKHLYDANNQLLQIKDASNNVLWENTQEHIDGRAATITYGNEMVNTYTYDNNLKLSGIKSLKDNGIHYSLAMEMQYSFDGVDNNLLSRKDMKYNSLENFHYDNLDRLDNITAKDASNTTQNLPIVYASNGNITQKYDAGKYVYNSGKPHALESNTFHDAAIGPMALTTHTKEQTITYTAFNKIATLSQTDAMFADTRALEIDYGFEQQRLKTTVKENGNTIREMYYIASANMEIIDGTEITYLYADGKPFAYDRKIGTGPSELFYLHLDYQQSIIAISATDGSIVEERSYDAWGRPRYPGSLAYVGNNPFGSSYGIMRGYTFHEHLEEFNLINMNGRMYDPILARFLHVDPLLQDNTNGQNFNSYSYVLNNPLKYTDPSGYAIIGAGGGAYSSGGATGMGYNSGGEVQQYEDFKDGLKRSIQDEDWWTGSQGGDGGSDFDGDPKVSNTKKSGTPKSVQDNLSPFDFSLTGPTTTQKINNYSINYIPPTYEINVPNGKPTYVNAGLGSPAFDPITMVVLGIPSLARGMVGLASRITTSEGFLFGSFTIRTPINISVQRFGSMSLNRPDYWGLRLGSNRFVNRTFAAIRKEWNPLTNYSVGVIPKGTRITFGLIGPQGLKYPGGSIQIMVNSRNVINQFFYFKP